ncbi:MAG: sulfurtransferase [Acidobacteria bacterium]|nr:sulfurtransferase [Acidobacteriota bacterium]
MYPIISPSAIPADAVLLDARPPDAYAAGHLRGARNADVDRQLSSARDAGADPRNGGRHPLPPIERFGAQLGAWGIAPSTTVVVYDDQAGANAAARAWWMLRAAGHENVVVLDGGYQAAVAAGMEVTTDVPEVAALPPYPVTEWQRGTVSRAEVDQLRLAEDWKVLDVRSAPRFRGETEPIDPIAGHIDGAVNLPYTENLSDGRFKSKEELRGQYDQLLGDVKPDHLVVHCGSGVTACHTLLALEAAGIEGAKLYVGSWSEWCRNR